MLKLTTLLAIAVLATATVIKGAPVPTGQWPTSTGLQQFDQPYVVAAGTTFDGGMKTYERSNLQCGEQKEGGAKDSVFLVQPGATIKNVIIGKNQMEGVYCEKHDCVLENVWWDDVCEDAFSIKGGTATSVTTITGGGARFAQDKIIQHNGPGKVVIDGFFAQDFGKLYRSCGTCGEYTRQVDVSNVLAVNPSASIITVNSNFNDRAVLKNIHIQSKKDKVTVCGKTTGGDGGEPTKAGDGADGTVCVSSDSDIFINGGNPSAPRGDSFRSFNATGNDENAPLRPVVTNVPLSATRTW